MLKHFETQEKWQALLGSCQAEYAEQGTFFLEEDYIAALQEQTGAFPRIGDAVLAEAAAVRRDTDAALYALFVCRAMEQRQLFLQELPTFTFPQEKYPLFALLCLLPAISRLREFLIRRKLPEDVLKSTLGQFEDCVFIYSRRFDRLGLSKRYFDWLQHYVDCEILNIGRLRFEIVSFPDPIHLLRHRQTGKQLLLMGEGEMNPQGLYADTPPASGPGFRAVFRESGGFYEGHRVSPGGRCLPERERLSKEEYELCLEPGETCLSVHIPDKGDFSPESCDASYRRATELFSRHFPELNVKAFCCHSWMMAPELGELLKPGSRIVAFGSRYLRYPIRTKGEDVLNFVFLLKGKTYEDLPEDTSLQRALKQRYLRGQYLYEYGGVFLINIILGPI